MSSRWPRLVLCLFAALTVACEDERPSDQDGPAEVPPDVRILVAQPDEYDAHVQQVLTLQAFLYRADGTPATNEKVSFLLMHDDDAGNPGGASLVAREATVDDNGVAEIELRSGRTGDIDLTVEVSAPAAQTRFIVVHVLDFAVGFVEVEIAYEGPVTVGPVDLFVMPGENRCPYNAVRVPLGEIASAAVPAAGAKATFGPFLEGTNVTLFARGMVQVDGRPTLGAQGCLDEVVIPGDKTLQVTLQMLLIPMNPVGSYDMQNHFDFTNAIPGTVGDIIQNLNQLFTDTGNWMIDRVQDAVVAFARGVLGLPGELIGRAIEWIIERFQPVLAGVIDDWIANSAPEWLRDFLQVGRDLMQVVNNLEVLSLMTFDKVQSDFQLSGDNVWSGVALYWRIDCEDAAPPSCGRHEFRIEDLLDTEYPLDAVWERFTARVVPYNGLRLNRHDVNLQYGRLILFVLNEMLLPRIADGARTLSEALVYAFQCPALADAIGGDDDFWGVCLPRIPFGGICFGVDEDDIVGFCEGAARLLGGLASELIDGLAVDSFLTLDGEAKMYEDTEDLLVDRIEQGEWRGSIHVGDASGDNLTGDFRGCRRTRATDREAPFTERCPEPSAP